MPKEFCCYCGKIIKWPLRRTTEHIIPISKGGSEHPSNKRPCCHVCNSWRGNKSLAVWKASFVYALQVKREQSEEPIHYRMYTMSIYDIEVMIMNIEYIQQAIRTATPKMWRSSWRQDKRSDFILLNT